MSRFTSRAYSSFEIRRLHGAVHWLMLCSRQGRNHFHRSSSASMSSAQVRNLNTFCSALMTPRSLPALGNGPYSLTLLSFGSRVNSTRGKSSRWVICR